MMPIERSVPAMVKRPPANSMSPSEASSRCAAACLPLAIDQRRGLDDRRTRRGDRARAAGAVAEAHEVAVVLFQRDLLEGNAELRRQHLRERRGVTLAVIERAGGEFHRAVGLEGDLAEFAARRCGDLEIGADRDAAQLAALAALLLALGEIGVIGNLQRLVEDAGEIAAVIGDAGGGRERQLRRLDEIALAQGQPVDAHLVGGAVDQPLHVVVGLGTAGAAIGAHQRGVGQHRLDVDAEQRRAVDAGEILAGVERQRPRRHAGDVGAEIAVALRRTARNLPSASSASSAWMTLRAALAVGEEAGRALVGPFHRTAERLRRVQDAGIFGIVDVLHAEGAADIGGQDADLVVSARSGFSPASPCCRRRPGSAPAA